MNTTKSDYQLARPAPLTESRSDLALVQRAIARQGAALDRLILSAYPLYDQNKVISTINDLNRLHRKITGGQDAPNTDFLRV